MSSVPFPVDYALFVLLMQGCFEVSLLSLLPLLSKLIIQYAQYNVTYEMLYSMSMEKKGQENYIKRNSYSYFFDER